MKRCKSCGEVKEKYYANYATCAECIAKRAKVRRNKDPEKYRRYDRNRQKMNASRMIGHRYTAMKSRVEGKATHKSTVEGKEICTRAEFMEFCEKQKDKIDSLTRAWVKSGYARKFAPSIDRIDNEKGYSIDNLQWIPQWKNSSKDTAKWARKGRRNEKGQFIRTT